MSSQQNIPSAPSPAEQAQEKLEQGDALAAETILRDAVADAVSRFGKNSPDLAAAHNDLGVFLLDNNRFVEAIELFRAACAIPVGRNRDDQKRWLSYQTNLAVALRDAGEQHESETVFQDNIVRRFSFYGREHVGYGYGIEPYTVLLLEQKRGKDALPLLDEAVYNFWRNQNPRIAGTLALRAEALKLAGDETPPFARLEGLPEGTIIELVIAILSRFEEADPTAYRAVLADLRTFLKERLGDDHEAYRNVLIAINNHERAHSAPQDIARRVEVLEELVHFGERRNDAEQQVLTLHALATAYKDAGRGAEANALAERALEIAERFHEAVQQENHPAE